MLKLTFTSTLIRFFFLFTAKTTTPNENSSLGTWKTSLGVWVCVDLRADRGYGFCSSRSFSNFVFSGTKVRFSGKKIRNFSSFPSPKWTKFPSLAPKAHAIHRSFFVPGSAQTTLSYKFVSNSILITCFQMPPSNVSRTLNVWTKNQLFRHVVCRNSSNDSFE